MHHISGITKIIGTGRPVSYTHLDVYKRQDSDTCHAGGTPEPDYRFSETEILECAAEFGWFGSGKGKDF